MKKGPRLLYLGLVALVFWFTLIGADPVSASGEWRDLGTLAGGSHTSAQSWGSAVSGDGSTVVGWSDDAAYDGNLHAFRWTQGTGMVGLGTLTGYVESQAHAASSDGNVVIGYSEYIPYPHAFRWTQAGMIDLGTLEYPGAPPDVLESRAFGVSADGSVIAGISARVGFAIPHFFRWTQAGGMVDAGEQLGMWNWRYALSADGNIIVGSHDFDYIHAHAFRLTPAGVYDLGTLTPEGQSWGHAVSADGSVVVGMAEAGVDSHAFRWTPSTGMADLGTLPGGTRSEAWGVSADGSVVVGWSNTNLLPSVAFRWTQATGIQTLNQWLADNGVNASTGDFQRANAVSADGNVVVGNLRNNHAMLVRVFPSTLMSLSVTLQGTGRGTVTTTGINCSSGTCTHTYEPGTELILTARASTGSAFNGWTGCETSSGNTCNVTMNSDETITASFSGAPKISVSPLLLKFGAVKNGAVSEKTITIKNTGPGDLLMNDINIAGTHPSEFSQANDCSTIPMGGSCTVTATFTPGLPFGKKSATLTISSNDPKKTTTTVKMSGNTPSPKITVSPMSLKFGSAQVESTSSSKTVTILNKGVSDLVVTDISLAGNNASEFAQTNDCSTLPTAGSCTVTTTFSPTLPFYSKSATLTISSNDPKRPITTVKMLGNAAPPKISVSPASLSFGSVDVGSRSSSETVTISNTGTSNLVINDISIEGSNASDFSQTNDCTMISTSASCTVFGVFVPASTGAKNATIVISSNDPNRAGVNVKVSGEAKLGSEVGVWDTSTWDSVIWGQ